jgi:hypothetical protein
MELQNLFSVECKNQVFYDALISTRVVAEDAVQFSPLNSKAFVNLHTHQQELLQKMQFNSHPTACQH